MYFNRKLNLPLFSFCACLSLGSGSLLQAEVSTYPNPTTLSGLHNLAQSPDYKVGVRSAKATGAYRQCFVYSSNNIDGRGNEWRPNNVPKSAWINFSKRTEAAVSFTSFTLDEGDNVTVVVTCKSPVSTAVISPTRLGIPAQISGRTITFTLSRHAKVMLEINGKSHPLLIFAEPPEVLPALPSGAITRVTTPITAPINIPSKHYTTIVGNTTFSNKITIHSGGVLHIAPGTVLKARGNNADIEIKEGGKLHVAPGAVLQLTNKPITIKERGAVNIAGGGVVEGTFKFTGNKNSFKGRGILTSGHISWQDFKASLYSGACDRTQFNMRWGRGDSHYFEGLMLLNTPGCTAREELTNSNVLNVKQISWNGNSDAFHLNGNSIMKDCFIFNNDDALILGSSTSSDQQTGSDNLWSNCTVSPGNWGHPIVAFPNNRVNRSDNLWDSIDIIGDFNSGVPVIHIKGDYFKGSRVGAMSNFTVRNVWVESPRTGPLFSLNTSSHPDYFVRNFKLENISAIPKSVKPRKSVTPEIALLVSKAPSATKNLITLSNVKIGGRVLDSNNLSDGKYFSKTVNVVTGFLPPSLLAYNFNLPEFIDANSTVPDVSPSRFDGQKVGPGVLSDSADTPVEGYGAGSLMVTDNTKTATGISVTVPSDKLDWNKDNWSIVGWFKRSSSTNDDVVFHIGEGDLYGNSHARNEELYLFCPKGGNTVTLHHYDGAKLNVNLTHTDIESGQWYHFAVVRSQGSVLFYLNGKAVSTQKAVALNIDLTKPLRFGAHSNRNLIERFFNGQLDELSVFPSSLTADHVNVLVTESGL
jgi:hypothetical protein